MDKIYDVKTEEFVEDYKNTLVEKEEKKNLALNKLDERVEARIAELRPELRIEIEKEINFEIEKEYKERIDLYEKYLVEKEEHIEDAVVECAEACTDTVVEPVLTDPSL